MFRDVGFLSERFGKIGFSFERNNDWDFAYSELIWKQERRARSSVTARKGVGGELVGCFYLAGAHRDWEGAGACGSICCRELPPKRGNVGSSSSK